MIIYLVSWQHTRIIYSISEILKLISTPRVSKNILKSHIGIRADIVFMNITMGTDCIFLGISIGKEA